jgi:hypothetical protein
MTCSHNRYGYDCTEIALELFALDQRDEALKLLDRGETLTAYDGNPYSRAGSRISLARGFHKIGKKGKAYACLGQAFLDIGEIRAFTRLGELTFVLVDFQEDHTEASKKLLHDIIKSTIAWTNNENN